MSAKRSAPLESGHEQGEGLGSTNAKLSQGGRRMRKAVTLAAAEAATPGLLSAQPANDQRRQISRSTRLIDMTWGEVHDELRALAQAPAELREVLDTSGACDLLGVSASTLWRLVRDGHIRPRIVSGSRRYLRSELMSYVELAHAPEVARHG